MLKRRLITLITKASLDDYVFIHLDLFYLYMALYLGHDENIYIPDMLFPLGNMTILKRLVLWMQGHLSILLTLVIFS